LKQFTHHADGFQPIVPAEHRHNGCGNINIACSVSPTLGQPLFPVKNDSGCLRALLAAGSRRPYSTFISAHNHPQAVLLAELLLPLLLLVCCYHRQPPAPPEWCG
jgi:hypothetical protein